MSLQVELKKSAVSQKLPFPSDLALGEIALNYNADGPFLTCKDTAGNIRKLNRVWVGATAPSSPTTGDPWLDTSGATALLRIYDGSTWTVAVNVPLATTSTSGTVQLASSADITNGTAGKVVDAAQLQSKITAALSAGTLTLGGINVLNNATTGGDLTVNGTTTFDSIASHPLGSAGAPTLTFTGDTNTGIYSPGADQVAISTSGTGRLFVDSSGRVGVGVASPATPFHVRASNTTVRTTGASTDFTAFEAAIDSGATCRIGAYIGSNGFVGTTTNHPLVFETNSAERLRITSDGKVGLGTSSPGKILDVRASNTDVRATCASTDYTAFLAAADSGVSCRIGAYASFEGFAGTTSNHPFSISTNDTTRLHITAAGNVLVGTSSDSGGALLQVNGDRIRVGTAKTPASATATGTAGEICWDASYVYVCIATNTWKRSALSTW